LDLKDKIVGRMAPKIVEILRGKNKNNFLPNLDLGDYVVLINAKYVTFTGNSKLDNEFYYNHSGYPGGLRKRSTRLMLEKYPQELVMRIIKGMMPHTKLGNKQVKRLFIFVDEKHNLKAQEKSFIKVNLGMSEIDKKL
jgi:large subunit ribosomal protein L13